MQWSMKFRPTFGTQRAGEIGIAMLDTHNGVRQHDRPLAHSEQPARRRSGGSAPDPDAGKQPRDGREEPKDVKQSPEPTSAGSLRSRLIGVAAVTAIEAVSIYVWLRLHEDGHPWWGLLALIAGEAIETGVLRRFVDRGGVRRWGTLAEGADHGHLRTMQRKIDFAGNAEIAIWVLWLVAAQAVGQEIAAVALLVTMHLKHHSETAAILDVPYRSGLFSPIGLIGTAMEVGGAVACLALILDGQLVLAAVAIGGGLMIEHWLLIDKMMWEIKVRDIRLARDVRWRPPVRPRPWAAYASSHFAPLWRLVQRTARLERFGNRRAINAMIGRIEPRANPLSTMASYTSWASLTDRSFSGRHLPPAPSDEHERPTSAAVAKAFTRDEMVESPKSTVLFSFFAQWFTDGILRTERNGQTTGPDGKPTIRNTKKNESNHDIDLAQLYGLKREATNQLRTGRGLLKSQTIKGEEYPPYYHRLGADGDLEPNPEFDKIPAPLVLKSTTREQKRTLFAMGTDTSNVGFVAFNVLFLREHNRIARQLGDEHPEWDGDRVFETTRNILTVVLLKIIVEDYINHISPAYFQFRLLSGSFPNEPWYRPNWLAIEFNLLYRWHCLVPSSLDLGGKHLAIPELLADTSVLTSTGLGQLMSAASDQAAGRMGLFNTDGFLVQVAETPSIEQARAAELASYNDYRRLCRHPPVTSFADISSNPKIQRKLAELYPGGVEDVEFYIGLFAEDVGPNDVLPPLMMTMVAFDAFSQALTNPLLAPRVFNEDTFTATGMKIIEDTRTISDLVHRNVPERPEGYFVSLTRRGYERT